MGITSINDCMLVNNRQRRITMIKKLDLRENVEIIPIQGSCHDYCLAKSSVLIKINELVDAVNEIMTWRFETDDEPAETQLSPKTENVDPYAEQRKWIGRLCQFWDFVYDHDYFDILKGITDKGLFIGHNGSWKYCEPVKPDDDIIYKGE